MMISGKVKAAAAAVALFSVLGLAGCGESGKPAASTAAAKVDNVKVKVGYSPSLCQAPIFVAYEKGYFKDAGLDPELVKVDGATANESLGSGKVDMEITLVSKTIPSAAERSSCQGDHRRPFWLREGYHPSGFRH